MLKRLPAEGGRCKRLPGQEQPGVLKRLPAEGGRYTMPAGKGVTITACTVH